MPSSIWELFAFFSLEIIRAGSKTFLKKLVLNFILCLTRSGCYLGRITLSRSIGPLGAIDVNNFDWIAPSECFFLLHLFLTSLVNALSVSVMT